MSRICSERLKMRNIQVLDTYSLPTTSPHLYRRVETIVNRYYDVYKHKAKDPKAFRGVEVPGCAFGCL